MLLHLLLFLALYTIFNHFVNKIRNLPPSPYPALPIVGHLYLFKKPLHRALSKISNRHGPVLLLHFGFRPVVAISSPSAIEECLTRNDAVLANRPRLLPGKHLGYNYTSLAWAPYGDHWRNLRRIASLQILSSSRLQNLSHIRHDEVRSLIRRFLRYENQTVEMKSMFFELTLNVMMRMIAGKRYYGENVAEVEEAKKFQEIVTATFRLGAVTNISDFLPVLKWVGGRSGYENSLIELQKTRDGFMQRLIDEYKEKASRGTVSGDKKKTMIEVLLGLQESEPEYYTDEIIKGIMVVCTKLTFFFPLCFEILTQLFSYELRFYSSSIEA
ncbi:hypothetical protein FEM48_Zijuj06G0039200 [Ziziphus jujuba var. spinosa]|uniref:Cytochrome P450 81E8-like n=1 Tax=Ziziphus jujuba var. spinosa TaxID=714518 RepID=A0A978V711_ZIZJJ|nr:hypothetical protein FEM48_Zijuj06G0039200 [Ziziphus jujuba var. spinosa]